MWNVVDYRSASWKDVIQKAVADFGPFTHVLDTVGSADANEQTISYESVLRSPSNTPRLLQGSYIKLGGHWTSWIAAGAKRVVGVNIFTSKESELFWVRFPYSTALLEQIRKAVDDHGVRPHVAEEMKVSETSVQEAFDMLLGRRTVGKIVLDLTEAIDGGGGA